MGKQRDIDGRVLAGRGKIDLNLLRSITQRPALFHREERSFWTDPYVAGHVLEAHLDPHIEDASRKAWQIQATVERIVSRFETDTSPRVLDLACGPGLYTEQLAARGFQVVGIDISERSLDHARRSARAEGLSIDYRQGSFLEASFDGPYDLITMIYGEFCTISDTERGELLERIGAALRPGGLLIFDVFTERYVAGMRGSGDFYVSPGDGFWQKSPHVVLEQVFRYPHANATVSRYTLVEESGAYRQFSVWWTSFTVESITEVLVDHGFTANEIHGNLWGDPVSEDDEWIGIYARRRAD